MRATIDSECLMLVLLLSQDFSLLHGEGVKAFKVPYMYLNKLHIDNARGKAIFYNYASCRFYVG